MSRFPSGSEAPIPFSDKKLEQGFARKKGPAFALPGEDFARECGVDPDMPPIKIKRRVRRGYEDLKR
jgi:hypothetical protein